MLDESLEVFGRHFRLRARKKQPAIIARACDRSRVLLTADSTAAAARRVFRVKCSDPQQGRSVIAFRSICSPKSFIAVTRDFEDMPAVAAASRGKIDNELFFRFPEVLNVVKICDGEQIAILGVEILEVLPVGYRAESFSVYDQQLVTDPQSTEQWPAYVETNNSLAMEFLRNNPMSEKYVYVLTTASWREFCEIRRIKRK